MYEQADANNTGITSSCNGEAYATNNKFVKTWRVTHNVRCHHQARGECSIIARTAPLAMIVLFIISGKSTSRIPTSSEKRLVMRPRGVEWKNDMGARRTDQTMRVCMTLEAVKAQWNQNTVRNTVTRAFATVAPMYLNQTPRPSDKQNTNRGPAHSNSHNTSSAPTVTRDVLCEERPRMLPSV